MHIELKAKHGVSALCSILHLLTSVLVV
jgi:hypothetical protein